MFLLSWQSDGFPNYITHETKKEDPNEVLSKIVSNHTQTSPIKENILNVIDEVQRSTMRRPRTTSASHDYDISGGFGEDEDGNDDHNDSFQDQFQLQQHQQVALYGYQIAELFLRKPEIAELIYLEMRHSNNKGNSNNNNQMSSNGFGGDGF